MSISLDDFEAAAAPVNYEQDVEYVKGTASITIEGSDSSTNVSVSTVGEVTSPVFSTLDNGADLDGVAGRAARFRTVLVFVDGEGQSRAFYGVCEGVITEAEEGDGGFGYDALFRPADGDGRTFAQMSTAEKNRISHRGRALDAFVAWLSGKNSPGASLQNRAARSERGKPV